MRQSTTLTTVLRERELGTSACVRGYPPGRRKHDDLLAKSSQFNNISAVLFAPVPSRPVPSRLHGMQCNAFFTPLFKSLNINPTPCPQSRQRAVVSVRPHACSRRDAPTSHPSASFLLLRYTNNPSRHGFSRPSKPHPERATLQRNVPRRLAHAVGL